RFEGTDLLLGRARRVVHRHGGAGQFRLDAAASGRGDGHCADQGLADHRRFHGIAPCAQALAASFAVLAAGDGDGNRAGDAAVVPRRPCKGAALFPFFSFLQWRCWRPMVAVPSAAPYSCVCDRRSKALASGFDVPAGKTAARLYPSVAFRFFLIAIKRISIGTFLNWPRQAMRRRPCPTPSPRGWPGIFTSGEACSSSWYS